MASSLASTEQELCTLCQQQQVPPMHATEHEQHIGPLITKRWRSVGKLPQHTHGKTIRQVKGWPTTWSELGRQIKNNKSAYYCKGRLGKGKGGRERRANRQTSRAPGHNGILRLSAAFISITAKCPCPLPPMTGSSGALCSIDDRSKSK